MHIQEKHKRHIKHYIFHTLNGTITWARSFTAYLSSWPSLIRDSMPLGPTLSLDVKCGTAPFVVQVCRVLVIAKRHHTHQSLNYGGHVHRHQHGHLRDAREACQAQHLP
uniref:Uncharacterized protein n=1 Tax=Oryza glumipatula TaxID=40148 RepID=A0A0E0BGS3_9ORYZ